MPVVLDSVEIEDGQSVLDVACGTGVIANGAAERVGATGSVTGVDNNPAMIAVASARSGNKVHWRTADAQDLAAISAVLSHATQLIQAKG